MALTEQDTRTLIEQANAARVHAYAPYSHYTVGAALRTKTGRIYTGVNIENAAYPTGICAERVAVFKAVSDGEKEFEAIALVTDNGGSPCGACRQLLWEFAGDIEVVLANLTGETDRHRLAELLPQPFDAKLLK